MKREHDTESRDAEIAELTEALSKIATGAYPYNAREAFIFVDIAKQIANELLKKYEKWKQKKN